MSRFPASALIVLLAVGLLAGGCGSKKNGATTTSTAATATSTASQSAAVSWAGGVCSAISTWKASLASAGQSARSNPTAQGVNSALASFEESSKTFSTTIKSLEAPQLQAVATAKTTLQNLKVQLQNDVASIKTTLKGFGAGSVNAAFAKSTISAAVATMRQQLKAAGDSLRSLPTGELKQAFQDAPPCQLLQSSKA